MCGRFSLAPKKRQLEKLKEEVELPEQIEISFNIAPTQTAHVIASDRPGELQKMVFGLVPRWSADGKNTGKTINARAEGIEERPTYREPLRSQRCLVVADSFYEWSKLPGGRRVPNRIFLKDENLLFMAGVWDEWRAAGGAAVRSFSIITTEPNLEMSALHNRMPLIFTDAAERRKWLSPLPMAEVLPMLAKPPDGLLAHYRVSEKLNALGANGAGLHEKVAEELRLF